MGTDAVGEHSEDQAIPGEDAFASDAVSDLIATKYAAPVTVPDLLARSDLVSHLSDRHGRFALISAPAGWGKSSLVTAWYETIAADQSFAFLSLESADDDSPLFWSYVLAALRTVRAEFMDGADAMLRSAGVDPMRGVIPRLINELSMSDNPIVLVLDDYHTITKQAIHDSVLFLIDHLPPCLSVVITTRWDPPFPLSRLRASGGMTELRAADLALTVDEAAQLLSNRFGLALPDDAVEELHRRAEGWPAGLQLAGISMQSEPDPESFVRRFSGEDRNVADYLTGEVLTRLPDSRRDFLLRTSVLDRLSSDLCDEVAGVSDSHDTLEALERTNLFLIPLDNRRIWYRYHHLMRDWLRHELGRTEPGAAAELRITASRWHAERGRLEAAVTYAIAGGDPKLAADWIDRYVTHWPQVNWPLLGSWFKQLPDDVIELHPIAITARVWLGMVTGDLAGAARWIESAEAGIDSVPADLRPTSEIMAELFRVAVAFFDGEMEWAREGARVIADELGRPDSAMVRPLRPAMHAGAIGLVALNSFWTLGARDSIPVLQEAVTTRAEASIPDDGFASLLALAHSEVGEWDAAEEAAAVAFTVARHFDGYAWPDLMPAHYALGRTLVARAERQSGIEEINKGLEMARQFGWPIFIAYGCLVLADALDDYVEKRALVREARELIDAAADPGRLPELIAAMERKLAIRRPAKASPGSVYVEPLTDRELETLRLLQTDLSQREIADRLYISHNTIKGYTKSIYRKLGVSSRASAIEIGRELDLI